MIFKTLNSDIDKWTSKIGIFGKSFNAIFDAKNQRKIDIDDLVVYKGMPLDEAKKQVGSLWRYLYPKKEDIQNQLIDVMPEINANDISATTEEIIAMASSVSKNKTTWQEWFNILPEGKKHLAKLGQQMEGQIITTEGVVKANQQARASALAHNEAIKAQTFSAKAGKVALQALATVGNMLAMWAITKGVELAVKGIDNLVHSAEHCKERVDELMSSYQSALDKANSNAKTIEDLASRYEELSNGVNNLGKNVSLSTDEYTEYNKIVNQIADMFPTMIQGYTNEGNAILSLKGNVEQLRDAYKEAQQEAYNMLIATGKDSGGNDIIANYQNQVNGANIPWFLRKNVFADSKKDGAKESIEIIKKLTDVSSLEEFLRKYEQLYEEYNSIWSSKDISTLNKSLQSLGIEDIFALTEEDFANIKRSAQTAIRTYQTEIDTALKSTKLLANAYLMTNEDYASLSDQCKNAASIMVNSLSSEMADGFEDQVAVGRYVDGIIAAIKDNSDVQDAVTNLFSIDTSNMSVSEAKSRIDEYTKTIAGAIDEDQLELKVRLGFEDIDDINKRLQNSIRKLTEHHGIIDRDTYSYLINEVDFKSFTQEQAEAWLKATLGAKDAADAVKKYKEAIASVSEDENLTTFTQAWSDLLASNEESIKELSSTLLDLAEKGHLTTQAFNEADSTGYFKNLGISADEAVSKINKLVDESQQLSSMSNQISKISEALASKRDDGFVSADTLSGFDVEIRGLDSWDRFQEVLGNVNSSYEECREAANSLATEWVNNSNFLSQLTKQNEEYYASQLKAMGVENYQEILEYAENLNIAKEALTQASFDLATATAQEVEELINEGTYSTLAQQEIWNLILAKQTAETTNLSTADDCQRLLDLATNAGVTGEAIDLLISLMSIYNGLEAGAYGTSSETMAYMAEQAEKIKNKIFKILEDNANKTIEIKSNIKLSPATKASAKRAGKETGKAYLDGLKSELSKMNSIISYVGKLLGKKITSYGKQKDDAIKALEAQKEAAKESYEAEKNAANAAADAQKEALDSQKEGFESQKDAIQGQIDAKQAEIDKINEAIKARKNELDLQKAQYDLARKQNQKTKLVNYMPDTIVI